ncbi:hypothetical protein GQ457_17G012440 [Hibiscus cannabinus]
MRRKRGLTPFLRPNRATRCSNPDPIWLRPGVVGRVHQQVNRSNKRVGPPPDLAQVLGLGPVSSWPSSVDRVKTPIFPTSRMEECRPVSSWPSSFDRVKTPIFPTSRMEECRPVSSWPSSFDRVKTSIFSTSRMEECRPVSSWPSSVDRVKTPIFSTSRMEECRPVSSWPSSFDRVKTPIFPTSRMEECRPVSSWPSSVDRVKTSIFPTSRMEECRPVSSWPSSVDRVKTSIFPTSRTEECRWRSATLEENNHAERCSLKKNTKKRGESQTLSLLKQTLLDKHLWILEGARHLDRFKKGDSLQIRQDILVHFGMRHISLNLSFFELGNRKRYCFKPEEHINYRESMSPQDAVKLVDWICQLNDFGRKGPESVTTYYFRFKFCLISSGAKEQTQRIEIFDLASSGSKEQIEVVTQRPWIKFVIALQFGQIKIGAFWSLPDSRFSTMCKEGQL